MRAILHTRCGATKRINVAGPDERGRGAYPAQIVVPMSERPTLYRTDENALIFQEQLQHRQFRFDHEEVVLHFQEEVPTNQQIVAGPDRNQATTNQLRDDQNWPAFPTPTHDPIYGVPAADHINDGTSVRGYAGIARTAEPPYWRNEEADRG